jgi:molybdenum cofactor cytidylyltransferase
MRKLSKKPTVGLIILAAGASTRMGSPKQLLKFGERSLIQHVVTNGLRSKCFPIIVVLGASKELLKPELENYPVFVAINDQWEEGMASSIGRGLEMMLEVYANVEAVIIMLCDQPFVKTTLINKMINEYRRTSKPVIASFYNGTAGVPALFSHALFKGLSELRGSEGAKKLIAQYTADLLLVPFPEGAVDIDTPEDYLGLQQV